MLVQRIVSALLVLTVTLGCDGCVRGTPGAAVELVPAAALTPLPSSPQSLWEAVPLAEPAIPTLAPIWLEAEHPAAGDFPARNPFAPATDAERARLSGGEWVGSQDPGRPLFLEYEVNVVGDANYHFYARKFWRHGAFRWRFDDGAWSSCDADVYLLDQEELRQHVAVNWVALGQAHLTKGHHRLRVELLSGSGAAAFDVFLLSQEEFSPRGKLKPQEEYPAPPSGWWTFDAATDPFVDSALDLRALNQANAGDDGFVQQRGSQLVFEKSGQPVRFWSANAGRDALFLPRSELQRYAKHLAKFGVNLVRVFGNTFREDKPRVLDDALLARLHLFVATLREEGIYTGLSVYSPFMLHLKQQDGFAGYSGQSPFALSYFDDGLQALERSWWKHALTAPNLLTGLTLAQDPALAYVELVNEDSTLFWTFNPYETIPEVPTRALETRFGSWLANKYGSPDQALSKWDSARIRGDEPSEGRVGFLPLWNISNQPSLRARDTAEFLARLMRQHYSELKSYIQAQLGYHGLTVCSNWHTADERVIGPLDNWANLACDVMDRHAYSSGPHSGDGAEYSVRQGQQFDDASTLKGRGDEDSGPFGALPPFLEPRYNEKPAFVSELGWSWPNRFRAEGPLLVAAYGRLTGLDAAMWFASAQPAWAPMLQKFEIKDPAIFGQFPAAALAFREGLVAEAPSLIRSQVTASELWSLTGAPVIPVAGLDASRAPAASFWSRQTSTRIDPLALLVGPVDVQLQDGTTADGGATVDGTGSLDLSSWLDAPRRTVRSRTGELSWDFGAGRLSIQAPALSAFVGFFSPNGVVSAPAMKVRLMNDYAAVALVALDGRSLAESQRMLLQVMTEVTNSGWSAPGSAKRAIVDPGHAPVLVRESTGMVQLTRPDAAALRVRALDAAGRVTRVATRGADEIVLLPDVLYYVVESETMTSPAASH